MCNMIYFILYKLKILIYEEKLEKNCPYEMLSLATSEWRTRDEFNLFTFSYFPNFKQ